MKAYLLKLCNGDPQKLAVLVGATSRPDAGVIPETNAYTVAEPYADELQKPADLSLAIAIVAGAEYTQEEQTTQTTVQGEAAVPVASSSPGKERAPKVTCSPDEELQTPVKTPQLPPPTAPWGCQYPCGAVFPDVQCPHLHREDLRHAIAAGMTSTQEADMMKVISTQMGAIAAEVCRMCKLQQEQCKLQDHQFELQCKDIELHQHELQLKETALKGAAVVVTAIIKPDLKGDVLVTSPLTCIYLCFSVGTTRNICMGGGV